MVNKLFYGDNLPVLKEHIATESVDLVYLDPPFNSNRSYSVIFGKQSGGDADAQIQAFDDTWHWTPDTERVYRDALLNSPTSVADAMQAFRTLLGENDAMAYLVMMAPRLVEMHRALKNTGSLYLHCDPTMSHYLKVLMDAIFGSQRFINEIIWHYNTGGKGKSSFLRKHDVILWYSKGKTYKFNRDEVAIPRTSGTAHLRHGTDDDGREYYEDYSPRKSGKKYRWYLDEGTTPMDVWTDIQALNPMAKERLGYPTQKPLALLERILKASTDPGDVVLDPFCGCGTTVDAAQKLGRVWAGIDITYISIDLIIKRLQSTYGQSVMDNVDVDGIPFDMQSARRLFEKSPFDFERWAVSMLHAQPNAKQVGDKGIDGVRRFILDGKSVGKVLVSVKGGKTVPPTHVRDLAGTVHNAQDAQLGVLVTLNDSLTRGAQEVIDTSGVWRHPANGQDFPVLQHISVRDLLGGLRPALPTALAPYISAQRGVELIDQGKLFG